MRSNGIRYLGRFSAAFLGAALLCLVVPSEWIEAGEVAEVSVSPVGVVWAPSVASEFVSLRCSGGGQVLDATFESGQTVSLDNDGSLADGSYTCELLVGSTSQTDSFTIRDGSFVDPTLGE